MWLQKVQADIGLKLAINWKYFSLEQANSKQKPQWKIWEQPENYPSRGLNAFRAAEAVRRQDETIFSSFHIALLKAKHEQGQDIADINTLTEVAKNANMDMNKFQKDYSDCRLLTKLSTDHTFAVETFGVFGTPTLVFEENQAIFVKLSSPPSPEESLSVFTEVRSLAEQRRYIMELKRPQPSKT
jgi:predicted DsbA family dithiol-disulfide isomerase